MNEGAPVRVVSGWMEGKRGRVIGTADGLSQKIYLVQFAYSKIGFIAEELEVDERRTARTYSSAGADQRSAVE